MTATAAPSSKDEIRDPGLGEASRDILDVLESTGAPPLAILKAFDEAAVEILGRSPDRYVDISFEPTSGTHDAIWATFHIDRLWADLTAATHKRLLTLGHGTSRPLSESA